MAGEIIVLVTCPQEESESLSCALIESQLAACVNILPGVRSIYKWEGKMCNEQESLLVIKSKQNLFSRLQERVKELHTYSVPEIIAIGIEDGFKPYIDWLNATLDES